MLARTKRKSFSDYFSPADFAHVNWLTGNKRTLLTGDTKAENSDDAADVSHWDETDALSRGLNDHAGAAGHSLAEAVGAWYGARRSNDMSSDAAERLLSATRRFQEGQGIERFERTPLPEPLVEAEANRILTAVPQRRASLLRSLLDTFAEDKRADVVRQFARHLPLNVLRDEVQAEPNEISTRPSRSTAFEGLTTELGAFSDARWRPQPEQDGFLRVSAPRTERAPPDWRTHPAPPPPNRPGCTANAKMVTCRSKNGPIGVVSFPRPDGWPEKMADTDYDFHEYEYVTVGDYVPSPEEEEAYRDRLFQELINDPTPGQNDRATPEGQINDVGGLAVPTVVKDFFGERNDVKSYVIEKDGQKYIVNVTQGNHLVSPGYVVRTVVRQPDGRYAIVTYGAGGDWTQSPLLTPDIKVPKIPGLLPNGAHIPPHPNPAYPYIDDYTRQLWDQNSKGILERARKRR